MEAEQLKILKMLEKGTITADEAQELLSVLDEAAAGEIVPDQATLTTPDHPASPSPEKIPITPPDFNRFRAYWRIPFGISLGGMAVGGLLLWLLSGGGWVLTILAIGCAWPLLIVATAGLLVSVWSRSATWVHVRVNRKDDTNINISVPAPISIVGRALHFFRRYAPEDQKERMGNIRELLDEVENSQDPLIVRAKDEDGDDVQIYIG